MDAVWIIVSVVGAILLVWGVGRFGWNLRPQPAMGGTPVAPLEKLGWVGLAVTTVVGLGLSLIIVVEGVSFFDNDTARGIFWLLLIGGFGIWAATWWVVKRRNSGTVVDERDRAILARSLSVESMIVLFSLVTWTIVLTEAFRAEGAIPLAYLQVIFWSTFIGGAFGRSLGIILGYHREIAADA
jgi:hypothetical protein